MKFKNNLTRFLITLLILCSIILLIKGNLFNNKTNFDTNVDIDKIKQIAQLASVEYTFKISEIEDYQGNKIGPFTIPGTNKFYVAIIKGTVVAGIDLNKITRFSVNNGEVEIELPKAEILHVYTDPSTKYEKYFEGIFADIKPEEITLLENKATEDLKKDAINNGILLKANENVKKSISTLLKLAGAKKVVFK